MSAQDALPEHGRPADQVLQQLRSYGAADPHYQSGRLWSLVYYLDAEHDGFLQQAYASYASANGLNPGAFKSLKRFESEIVAAAARLQHGGPETCGVVTSGGTESCLLAVKTYRDLARATRGVRKPEMIVPTTAHVAWFKASEYFDVELRLLPLDERLHADVSKLEAMVNRDTVMILGSAPEYPHGSIDPIAAMGEIAQRHGVPLHVDACVGGFILPFMAMNGVALPPWDYRVPGVTSISADLHKYGFAPKGSSVILYRDAALRAHQIYACSAWSGYTVVNTTVQSTKSGGPLAGAWAALNFIGDDGYMRLFGRMYDATRRICAGIDAHPDLFLLAPPDANLVAIGSNTVDVFHVCDEMRARNWFIQPQLSFAGSPKNFHLSINPKADGWVDAFLADLDESVQTARSLPSGNLRGMIEAMMAAPGGLDVDALMGALGVDGPALPSRMAPINEVLDVLPPAVRERLLVDFVNRLYAPRT